jgi:uncharacterized membrane protein
LPYWLVMEIKPHRMGTYSRVKHNKGQCSVAGELKIQVLLFLKATCFLWSIMSDVGMMLRLLRITWLVLFLINFYSQDYNYTLKYSYGHYMVFVVSVTIFSVLQFLFCLQNFVYLYFKVQKMYQKSVGSVTSKKIF